MPNTTNSRFIQTAFNSQSIGQLQLSAEELSNWPVVYTLNDSNEIYVGETTNVEMRLRQHLQRPDRRKLKRATVVLDPTYNKSACLDLESHLIRYFSADGKYLVQNGNGGITDADYYQRDKYRESFNEIFEQLQKSGMLQRSIPDLENSVLFKYSPFKALNTDQAVAIEGILEKLVSDIENKSNTPIIVQGEPGTGKTIVSIYLIKLMIDIARSEPGDAQDVDSLFSEFFTEGYKEIFENLSVALVIPQVSLRASLKKVFKRTPGLDPANVLSQFELGKLGKHFDLLIVDEAHRLQHRANQAAASQNKAYAEINKKLFGQDDNKYTQLDWVRKLSTHQILLLDTEQSVKPADIPTATLQELIAEAKADNSVFRLSSQMRVNGGKDYIQFVRDLLELKPKYNHKDFGDYDFRFFDDLGSMVSLIQEKESEHGLSRLVAGFAWKWKSKKDKTAYDIEIGDLKLRWNGTDKDWINSKNSANEVGSIHTVQGYDLNYAGVIIGPELGYDPIKGEIVFHRDRYFDAKGKENNPRLGIIYSDEDLKAYVLNVYRVLLTRGIQGTYLYVCDPALRSKVREFLRHH